MTPEERALIDDLFRRLRDAEAQPRDPEAERLIREAAQHQPNAVYYMTQAVLFQQQALAAAQQKIESLESRVRILEAAAATPAQPAGGGGFMGGVRSLWGAPPSSPAVPAPMPQQPASGGPWGRRLSYPAAPAAPGYSQPGYGQPGFGPGMGHAPQAGGGFLAGAAQTAAGVAGGMLAASAIQSLFSSGTAHAAGDAAEAARGAVSETTINNFYGNPPPDSGVTDAGMDDAGFDDTGSDGGDDWI